MDYIGYFLAILVGISLGLIGSGGSILTVPILVYIMGINPVIATGYSLFIVGSTSLVGGINKAIHKQVDFKTIFVFGLSSIAVVFATRKWIVPGIPDTLFTVGGFTVTKPVAMMVFFAFIMILASINMIKPSKFPEPEEGQKITYNYPMIFMNGIVVGLISGLVGAGGGFLIIPALVLLARMPMKTAIGTSLFIIAINSLIGFTGDILTQKNIDWKLLVTFAAFSIAGIFIGIMLSKKIPGAKLKKGFGWFVLAMGLYIMAKELL